MKTSKLVENMAFAITEELAKTEEYRTLSKRIVKLQNELRKELSKSGIQTLLKISELETESEAFSIDFTCNQAFLHGIALGQAAANKK